MAFSRTSDAHRPDNQFCFAAMHRRDLGFRTQSHHECGAACGLLQEIPQCKCLGNNCRSPVRLVNLSGLAVVRSSLASCKSCLIPKCEPMFETGDLNEEDSEEVVEELLCIFWQLAPAALVRPGSCPTWAALALYVWAMPTYQAISRLWVCYGVLEEASWAMQRSKHY